MPPFDRPRAEDCETPTVVGIGLIRRDGCFLVRKRPDHTVYAGYWEFPGGKCEPGEQPFEAVERECLEETGLIVVVGRCRYRTVHHYPHGLVELHFHDCTPADAFAEPADQTGFCWVPARELGEFRFPEANEAVVEELVREAKSRRSAD
jgi:mutator protein MutT